jgi:hypothetical protein
MNEIQKIREAIERKDVSYLLSKKRLILSKLKSLKKDERVIAWSALEFLIDNGNLEFFRNNKGYLRSLLWNRTQGIRDEAWNHLEIYKILQVEGVDRALTANSDKIKWSAWSKVLEMIKLGIVDKASVIEVRNSYWRLLKSRYGTIKKKAWRLFIELVSEGIFTSKDKERFKDFLRHKRFKVRFYAWSTVPRLLEIKFLTREEIIKELAYLEEMTKIKGNIGSKAKSLLNLFRVEKN